MRAESSTATGNRQERFSTNNYYSIRRPVLVASKWLPWRGPKVLPTAQVSFSLEVINIWPERNQHLECWVNKASTKLNTRQNQKVKIFLKREKKKKKYLPNKVYVHTKKKKKKKRIVCSVILAPPGGQAAPESMCVLWEAKGTLCFIESIRFLWVN